MPAIEHAGATLHFHVEDLTPPWVENPETIIFHHGVGTTGGIWAEWAPALAGTYRVVRLDVRGHGASSVPEGDFNWTMEGLVADVLAVADDLGAGKFHMVGESTGGTACYFSAIHHADRIASITCLSAGHRGGDIRKVGEWRAFIEANGMAAWSEEMMDNRFMDGAISTDSYDWFHREQAASAPSSALGLGEMLIKLSITDELSTITAPTLILHPDQSPFLPVSMAEEAHALIAGSELHVLADARHGIAFSHAAEGARLLSDFLARRCR